MSASLQPLTVAEFLEWERCQPARYEFDGTEPHAMTGGSPLHSAIGVRLTTALSQRVPGNCTVFNGDLKVMTADNMRVRYPDASVACGINLTDVGDSVEPTAVFEVLSPSTKLTDMRVKVLEYANTASIMVYVIIDPLEKTAVVRRRENGWEAEYPEYEIPLPEIGLDLPLSEVWPA